MLGFLARRMALAVVTGFAVLTLVFFVIRVLPGNPAHVILGDFAGQAAIEALQQRLGLDAPSGSNILTSCAAPSSATGASRC